MGKADDEIDRLYQLPLAEFTPARNALARQLGRTDPPIARLEKPNVAAWAVNQLYWHERPVYDALVKASDRLRAEHRKLLAGKSSDIRDSEKAHRDAVRAATDKVRGILKDGGQAATPATLTAVTETLEALPSSEPPGRLTRPLKPLGFEALAGATITPAPRPPLRLVPKGEPPPKPDPEKEKREARERALQEKRAREAEKQREREEAERKRQAEKELRQTEAALARAREAVRKAEEHLDALKQDLEEAVTAHRRATLRARE
jgi:hypothetical protein